MKDKRTLSLADINPVLANFNYWSGEAGEREIEWFRHAWQAIIDAELADYQTDLERCQVAIRCIALHCIYTDFLSLIDVDFEPYTQGDMENLEIKTFQLGVLLKEEDWELVKDETDEVQFCDSALKILMDRERPQIFEALCKKFGGRPEGACNLYISLWRIASQEEQEEVSDEEILEDVQYNDAFMFVMDGFPHIC
jgi:hypothetical protein